MKCALCQKETKVYYMCDYDTDDLQYCENCFEDTACGMGEHEEGCATKVFEE